MGALNKPIEDAAKLWGVEADIIRAVMYYENAAGGLKDWLAGDRGNSIQPMNVGRQWAGRFGLSVEALRHPNTNVNVGTQILRGIIGNLPANASVAEVYTLYNNLDATRVSWRGVQVQRIYDERLWE